MADGLMTDVSEHLGEQSDGPTASASGYSALSIAASCLVAVCICAIK